MTSPIQATMPGRSYIMSLIILLSTIFFIRQPRKTARGYHLIHRVFSYGAGGASAYQPGYSGPSGEHVVPGFVTGYATTAIEEDMAETYAYLMTTTYYHHLQTWQVSDVILANKVNYLIQFISKISPEMSADYFNAINR